MSTSNPDSSASDRKGKKGRLETSPPRRLVFFGFTRAVSFSRVAAIGDLRALRSLYDQVFVPFEVGGEILGGGASGFAVAQFEEASWLQRRSQPVKIAPYLPNMLDVGEASVIQLALTENIDTVGGFG